MMQCQYHHGRSRLLCLSLQQSELPRPGAPLPEARNNINYVFNDALCQIYGYVRVWFALLLLFAPEI